MVMVVKSAAESIHKVNTRECAHAHTQHLIMGSIDTTDALLYWYRTYVKFTALSLLACP